MLAMQVESSSSYLLSLCMELIAATARLCQCAETPRDTPQEALLVRDDYHTLIRAFRAFDPEGKGYCYAEQMKNALQSKGEPLTDDELNRMLGFAADENGKLFYEDYCQKLSVDGRTI